MDLIGNGLLATAVRARCIVGQGIVFASGVSNSHETDVAQFERESNLLAAYLKAGQGPFVYFSTCSISDPERANSAYVVHKQRMEGLVAAHPQHLILRLPQVVGKTANPHTLTNFIASSIVNGTKFSVWKNARRCIIDVEDVAKITSALLECNWSKGIYEVAPPETVSMLELVKMMEKVLGKNAQYDLLDRGGEVRHDSSLMLKLAARKNIDLSGGYAPRVLQKYYGTQDET